MIALATGKFRTVLASQICGYPKLASNTHSVSSTEGRCELRRKTTNAAADPSALNRKGYYGELAFGFAGLLQIGGLYQDYQGDPNGASLGLFATLPKFETIKLSGYYLRKNMKSGFDDAFKLDERSLLAASAAYRIFGPLYLRVDFQRRWVLMPNAKEIRAVDNFQAGLATFIAF